MQRLVHGSCRVTYPGANLNLTVQVGKCQWVRVIGLVGSGDRRNCTIPYSIRRLLCRSQALLSVRVVSTLVLLGENRISGEIEPVSGLWVGVKLQALSSKLRGREKSIPLPEN